VSRSKTNDPFTRHPTRHRGIVYRVRDGGQRSYYVYGGGRYVAAGSTEKEAVAKQAELRGKAARGEPVIVAGKATFCDVADAYMESKHRLRAGTRQTYRSTLDRVLIPRFGSKRVAAITVEHVAALIRDLDKKNGLAPSTIQAYLMPLHGVMSYAVRRRLIPVNPCDQLIRDDRPHAQERRKQPVWSDGDIAALIEASERLAKQKEARYDYSALIRVAAFTGLRLGELLGLQWQDVDLTEGVLRVERQWLRPVPATPTSERQPATYGPPKTKAGMRNVPLTRETVKHLSELKLRSDFSQDTHPVFASRNGKPLGHRNVTRRGFEPAAEKAKLDATFHGLRHAYGSKLVAKGVPLAKVAEVMGHESAAITLAIYTHVYNAEASDDEVREAIA
jgi:integrase